MLCECQAQHFYQYPTIINQDFLDKTAIHPYNNKVLFSVVCVHLFVAFFTLT